MSSFHYWLDQVCGSSTTLQNWQLKILASWDWLVQEHGFVTSTAWELAFVRLSDWEHNFLILTREQTKKGSSNENRKDKGTIIWGKL